MLARTISIPLGLGLCLACGHGGSPPAATAGAGAAGSAIAPSSRPPSTRADKKQVPAMAECHRNYKPTAGDNVAADVEAMAKGCADATKMHAAGGMLTGERAESSPANVFPLDVQAGHCYRAYGISTGTLQDLDLALVDSAGGLAGEDSTDDVSPVLLEDGAICFKAADKARIEVTGGSGGGKFALQVWSD